jgi:hypothetical protein
VLALQGHLESEVTISHHLIAEQAGLDPINLIAIDMKPGQGRLVVTCYAEAWTCFWGAMGDGRTVLEFLRTVSPDYVANCLIRGRRPYITNRAAEKRESDYLERICAAIKAYAERTTAAPRVAHV